MKIGMGGVFLAILSIFLLFGAFSGEITDGIKTWRTNDTTESFVVAVGAAVTTANVTLSYDLFQDATAEVQSITSTDGTDTPVATSYVSASKKLLISGLNDDASRTLTVKYYAETDSTVMRTLGPFLTILIMGGLAFLAIWGSFGQKR